MSKNSKRRFQPAPLCSFRMRDLDKCNRRKAPPRKVTIRGAAAGGRRRKKSAPVTAPHDRHLPKKVVYPGLGPFFGTSCLPLKRYNALHRGLDLD